MGCHMQVAQQRIKLSNQKSLILQNQLQSEYSSIQYRGRGNVKVFDQYIAMKIDNIKYQLQLMSLYGIFKHEFQSIFHVNCEPDVFQTLPIKSNHYYDPNLYAQLVKKQLSVLKYIKSDDKIITLKQNQKHQFGNLVLNFDQGLVYIRCLKLKKLIVKIQIGKAFQLRLDKSKYFLLNLTCDGKVHQKRIQFKIINIQNRSKLFSQPLLIEMLSFFEIYNTNDLLLNIESQGLVLYNLDYANMKIQRTKLIFGFHEIHVPILDENNLLHLFSKDFYLKYDKDYNVIKKFKINFQSLANSDLCWNSITNPLAKQPSDYCFNSRGYHFKFNQMVSKRQIHQENTNKQEKQYITEFTNYQKEYTLVGSIQHLISQDQRYLTYRIEQNLIFYKIYENQEYQIFHNKKIIFLNFSTNSYYLYVVLEDRVNCYKANQSLKLYYRFHLHLNHLSSNQNGILITINDKVQVKTISKQYHKQIFKLNAIQTKYISFEYQTKDSIILVSSKTEISLFNLIERKLIWNQQIINRQSKINQNTEYFFIITEEECVELWCFQSNNVKYLRNIMSRVYSIQYGYSNLLCLRNREYILIFDQNFNFLKQIYYQQEYLEDEFIDNYSQILQENFILRVNVNINYDIPQIKKILISLDSREHTNV